MRFALTLALVESMFVGFLFVRPYRGCYGRQRPMLFARTLSRLLLSGLLLFEAKPVRGDGGAEFGPLFSEFKLTLEPGRRKEALGPFYYEQESGATDDTTRVWAVPPLVSRWRKDDLDSAGYDFLWKAITYKHYGSEYRFQLLQLFSIAGGEAQSETNVHRL